MKRTHHSHNALQQAGEREAEAEALNLKLGGMSYRTIAQTQACSVSTAHSRVQRALASIVPEDKVEELRKIENERMSAAVAECLAIMAGAEDVEVHDGSVVKVRPSVDQRLAAIGRLTKASERISKLNGLDVPVVQKVEVMNVDALDEQINELLTELGQLDA